MNPRPEMPTIYKSNDTLYSTSAYGNQWFYNGNAIPWGTDQGLKITGLGDYHVEVTSTAGCTSPPSEVLSVTTNTNKLWPDAIKVYPNPFSSTIHVDFPYSYFSEIKVLDSRGKEFQRSQFLNSFSARINLEGEHPGIYLIVIETRENTYCKVI